MKFSIRGLVRILEKSYLDLVNYKNFFSLTRKGMLSEAYVSSRVCGLWVLALLFNELCLFSSNKSENNRYSEQYKYRRWWSTMQY